MSATALETKQSPWWLVLLGGILNIIIGIMLLAAPAKTTVVLVWTLGLYWVIAGIFALVGLFIDRSAWGWKLFIGVVSILAGLTILSYPILSAVTIPTILVLVLGIQGLIVGIILLVQAFKGGGWGAGILGVLSIIFGIILLMNWNELMAVVSLIYAAAFLALFGGIVQLVQAFRQRQTG